MPESIENTGTADNQLRKLLTDIIRDCPKKRLQIAEELSELLGQSVTVHMLNDFTSESKKPARFPALFILPLCQVVGDDRLQRHVMGNRLRMLVEFAERELAASRDEFERTRLRNELLGVKDV
jgi:hypothetical protein